MALKYEQLAEGGAHKTAKHAAVSGSLRSRASIADGLFHAFVLVALVVRDLRFDGRLDARPERSRLLSEFSFDGAEVALDEFCYGATRLACA
jgi:hypothetical protein